MAKKMRKHKKATPRKRVSAGTNNRKIVEINKRNAAARGTGMDLADVMGLAASVLQTKSNRSE